MTAHAQITLDADTSQALGPALSSIDGSAAAEQHQFPFCVVALHALGDYQMARHLCEDTLACYRRMLGDDHPDTLWSANSLAAVLHALGEGAAAVELYREAWLGRRRRLGATHPHTRDSAQKLDLLLEQLGRPHEARLTIDLPAATPDTGASLGRTAADSEDSDGAFPEHALETTPPEGGRRWPPTPV